jgi:N-carbamoyl-L-amino-acid hydrolase
VITPTDLAERLFGLEDIGITEQGVYRLAWTAEDLRCREWFAAQARQTGLTVASDPAGNLWACPGAEPPWWGVGSHLDSVRGGGRFDGPLGVVCGFAIAAASPEPVAVVAFADEEGARFNTPTFGSKALAGRLDLPGVLERRDEHGIALGEAMRAAGVDPGGIADAPAWLARLCGFFEIHIDQSRGAARAGAPVSIVSALAARMRLEADLHGRADHAGTTPRDERRDALAAAARLIIAADELDPELTVTTARIHVEPNAATTIAEHVRLWIDARGSEPGRIDGWRGALIERADAVAQASGVEIRLAIASRSDGTQFDVGLRRTLRGAAERMLGMEVPEDVCFAGHDAGVLADRLAAAMVLVRNPTGVSHCPAEEVSLEDAAAAARVVLAAIDADGGR